MPTASQTAASSRKGGSGSAGPAPRPSVAALPLPARPVGKQRQSSTDSRRPRRGSTATELLPARRDSSIGATSSNPRLRRGSVLEAAAQRTSSTPRTGLDTSSPAYAYSMLTLRRLLLPVVLRVVLQRRRRSRWRNRVAPRRYTSESVVAAMAGSQSMLAEWPMTVLERLAEGATFQFLGPREYIVYGNESHVSSGLVVLLHGQLEERRAGSGAAARQRELDSSASPHDQTSSSNAGSGAPARPIRTQAHRLHKATDVLCVMSVLCEDRSTSSLSTRDSEEADVAVIPSHWFWEVYYAVTQAALPATEVLTRCMSEVVVPRRRDIVLSEYFPTSVALLRSWMWPMLTASDRVKLSRAMEARVLTVGERLVEEGVESPYLYVVRRGALSVMVKGEPLALLEAGACIGEDSVLFHSRRNSTIVAATICEVYVLHARHIEHRVTKYPELGGRLIEAALRRQSAWMEAGKIRDVFGLVSILSGVPCLAHTTEAMREELAQLATVRTHPQGHTFVTTNTPCNSLFIVGRGTVALTSVIMPTTIATSPAAGEEPAPSRGRSSGTPSGSPRRSVSMLLPLTKGDETVTAPELRRDLRSTGDFVGELFLKQHLWPYNVSCESMVCVWEFDRAEVLRVLEEHRADAQAMETCRQGISLYRAQRGEASLVEGFVSPASPTTTGVGAGSRRGSAARRPSVTPAGMTSSQRRSSAVLPNSAVPRMSITQLAKSMERPPSAPVSVEPVTMTTAQWTDYAVARLREAAETEESANATTAMRELREVDKEVEKALKEKVLRLIAVQPRTTPNAADCDISGPEEELQSIIVEQLFLIPTVRQPRFIRQVNDSNVRLITEGDPLADGLTHDGPLDEGDGPERWRSSDAPISVNGVVRLEEVEELADEEDRSDSGAIRALATYSFKGTTDQADVSGPLRMVGEPPMETSMQGGLPPTMGRSRRAMSIGALEDSAANFMTSLNARSSFSRSHFVRPPSGVPVSPRNSIRGDAAAVAMTAAAAAAAATPRGGSMARLGSSSEPRVGTASGTLRQRPTSVDFNQFNRLGVERSTSVLDRYVKIEDQNYFDNFVKVLPLQQDEIWGPEEGSPVAELSSESMVLLLLHVRKCDYLVPEEVRQCRRPIVKVMLNQRVLVRTPVMEDFTAPHWPIEQSSFISLIRRGADLVFHVCDADDEDAIMYTATLATASLHENGGVGQRIMTLTPQTSSASREIEKESEMGGGAAVPHRPRLTAMMLAVTASKYKALRQYWEARDGNPQMGSPVAGRPDTTTLFLHVMAVEGLNHRIEASVSVRLYTGASLQRVLETDRVVPKSRSPAWPAERAFAKISGEGGILTFDLQHKGAVISSAEATVDELVFGGVGLRRLPLLLAQTGSTVVGQLVLNVLGGAVGDAAESRSRNWVTHLAVEALTLSDDGVAITPDPFVVLRDSTGAVRLKTPLACAAFSATWTLSAASCLLPCPRLTGSSTAYQLEVCDSDISEVIGRATVTLTEHGLLDGPRREIPLDPPGVGHVRLRSLCLPVLELAAPTPQPLAPDSTLLMVHVGGCTGLPGVVASEFQTDAIATIAVDGRQLLRTSLQEGTTNPRWSLAKASVLLHVPSPYLEALVAKRVASPASSNPSAPPHEFLLSIYDGIVEEVNNIGQVGLPLPRLLCSAAQSFPLFPLRNGAVASLLAESASASASRTRPAERSVGQVQVQTLFGRLGRQVEQEGVMQPDADTAASAEAVLRAARRSLPYYDPAGAEGVTLLGAACAARDGAGGTTGAVLLGISSICYVLPNASSKYIHLRVRRGDTVVLSLERAMGISSHVEWGLTESAVPLQRSTLNGGAALIVELRAMDIIENTAGETGEVQRPVEALAASRHSTGEELLWTTALPAERLSAVAIGEVTALTISLTLVERRAAANGKASGTAIAEVKPSVSLCVLGSRQ